MSLKMLSELLELYSVFLFTSVKWILILSIVYYCLSKCLVEVFRIIAFVR